MFFTVFQSFPQRISWWPTHYSRLLNNGTGGLPSATSLPCFLLPYQCFLYFLNKHFALESLSQGPRHTKIFWSMIMPKTWHMNSIQQSQIWSVQTSCLILLWYYMLVYTMCWFKIALAHFTSCLLLTRRYRQDWSCFIFPSILFSLFT